MKKKLTTIFIILIFAIGLLIMLYPTISNWYNKQVSSYAVATYQDATYDKTAQEAEAMLEEARVYNESLYQKEQEFIKGAPVGDAYINTLEVSDGMMGFITIDKIDVYLPIYHGTAESELQKGVGHLEGSSFPIGDDGGHSVITGHTGLPSAMLFTDLNQLVMGDRFQIDVLDKTYIYEVSEIQVVDPDDVDSLVVQEGKDLVTLITCTPYGVNSHRLLVHGERVLASAEDVEAMEGAESEVDVYTVMGVLPTILVVLSLAIMIRILLLKRKKKKKLTKK